MADDTERSDQQPADSEPALATPPDLIEQQAGADMDDIVPTRGYYERPMVAIGGSAGALPAVEAFLREIPSESGLIFVIVLHLSSEHESMLPSVLTKHTRMPVVEPKDGDEVEPNRVYVIPSRQELSTVDGHFRVRPLIKERGRRVVVDLFFRSLADTHGPHAAAVVLSGADGDGAIGLKRIKERGGLTIAQDPDESEFPGMPRAAIETGMVDWVLRASEMPARLLGYFGRENARRLPPESTLVVDPPKPEQPAETVLREILIHLRMRTGREFSYYKRATVLRRIARRMQVNDIPDLPSYLAFLRTHPGEAGALLQDLLISVTNFFRDRDAFDALAQHIPRLFEGKGRGDSVRVWIPACATGEEAYSVAMLLLEHARTIDDPPVLQVFACDLDEDAIAHARTGLFLDAIEADVSEDRLSRFFVKEHRGYRVRRELREMILFAVHDLLKDAPFSRMDLISCRNLLIYLNREAQKRVVDTFHFSLRPAGLLFLGSSESIEDGTPLFDVADKRFRIYTQRPALRASLPVPISAGTLVRAVETQERSGETMVHSRQFLQSQIAAWPAVPPTLASDRGAVAEFHLKLLERLAPPSVLINRDHDIVHMSEQAGRFLRFRGGEPTKNLLRLIHPAIRLELRSALFRATEGGQTVDLPAMTVELDGESITAEIAVTPVDDVGPGLLLVLFDVRTGEDPPGTAPSRRAEAPEPLVRQLERELEQVKGHLRDTIEQYEASTEEMKASNEELQAMNEELRSATEELETSREELQSINEELTTVNAEMKSKMDELAHANADLQNLMASTSIATVFLDRSLAIKRYTPSAVELFHLIPGDLGRPLAHLKHSLDYPDLIADADRVLRTLVPGERDVSGDGRWYLVRLQPYRTAEDHIAGVVLTLVDITDRKQANEALRRHVEELTRFNEVAVGRELRMVELKAEVNELARRLGEPPRYNEQDVDLGGSGSRR